MGGFKVRDGETFLFIGDSITDCGRRAEAAPLGDGFVRFTVDLVRARYPEREITFLNRGINGNTVLDLKARWEEDALEPGPDWLAVMIGINDVHKTLDGRMQVPPDVYEPAYRGLLEAARKHCAPKLLLLDPFFMSTEQNGNTHEGTLLEKLAPYLATVEKLAGEFDAIHVRTHEAFQEQFKTRPPSAFGDEPVHPNAGGHMIIAHAVLAALGW